MIHARFALLASGLFAMVAPACNGSFASLGEAKRLVVEVVSNNTGSKSDLLPVNVVEPTTFTVNITAQLPDGTVDTSFNGYVNVLSQPGTVSNLDSRNVQLQNGVYQNLQVPVVGAFGETHIWADDLGYQPASPNRTPPPECSDGIDNNHNGLIDYPADPGCYAEVDDSEDLGSYASGASQTLFFALPRIDLVRGYDPANNGNGNATPFPNSQVSIDTGWRGGTTYDFSTIVIGLSSSGFFAQDLESDLNPAPGYGGIYAYNFSTPTDMRVCDRLQVLSGTAADFYGYTELNYPAWQIEYWDPWVANPRPCGVPEPSLLGVNDLLNDTLLWQDESTLVRVETAGTISVQIASDFGPEDVPYTGTGSSAVYTPAPGKSNCDYNHDGKINYEDSADTPSEGNCSVVCSGTSNALPTDFQCSEYSAYASENDFILVVTDSSNTSKARIQADGAAADLFDPVSLSGQTIRSFTGIVAYFSGGSQFTIQARCEDDVVTDINSPPLTSNQACVTPRATSAFDIPQ